jgi:RNase H-fold protein (predicted Holliday junction resolvase)
MNILSIDPGKSKFGVAVVNCAGLVLYRKVIRIQSGPAPRTNDIFNLICAPLAGIIDEILLDFTIGVITLGDKTASKQYLSALGAVVKKDPRLSGVEIIAVDESRTTEAARALYHRHNPPFFLLRWLPLSLIPVSGDVDDFAAVAIALKYLKNK